MNLSKFYIQCYRYILVMADLDAVVARLQKLGLAEVKAKETAKNKSLSSNLLQLLDWAGEGAKGSSALTRLAFF